MWIACFMYMAGLYMLICVHSVLYACDSLFDYYYYYDYYCVVYLLKESSRLKNIVDFVIVLYIKIAVRNKNKQNCLYQEYYIYIYIYKVSDSRNCIWHNNYR